MRFHDGRELTSKDVVYTFRSFLDPGFVSARKGAYRQLASVTALDDYRVEFKLTEPFGSFRIQLVMPVVPADSGGSGQGNLGAVEASPVRAHRRELSINLTIPPLGAVFLKKQ